MKFSVFFLLFSLVLLAQERALYTQDFNTQNSSLFLPVKIDGKECSFLFDTGASFVVLDKSFKELLGEPLSLDEAQARTGIEFAHEYIVTPNGRLKLEMYKAIPLKLGKLQVANRFPYILADLQALWPFSGEKFCGILGASFLHQFRWEIDFEQSKIKAYIGAEPYSGKYNTRTPVFWSKAHIPQILINLQGKEVVFDIDTGDNGSGRIRKVNLVFLKKHYQILASQEQDVLTVSSLSKSKEYRLHSLRVADVVYPKIVMQESGQNAIGLSFLKRHNIVFDFPFNMLYFQHHKDYAQKEELDKSGLRIILKDKRFIVFSIKALKGTRIEGICVGDEIMSVDGEEGLNLFKLRALLRGKEGTELSLTIRRKGVLSKASIKLGQDPL